MVIWEVITVKSDFLSPWCHFLSLLFHSYVEKFTDFLRLFVDVHLKRFESNAHFPVVEFLALLYKYTFKQVKSHQSGL